MIKVISRSPGASEGTYFPTKCFVGACIFHIAMAANQMELDLLAKITPAAGDLELSNTSSSNDEVKAQAHPGPSPAAGTRVLNMSHTPNTERNLVRPISFPRKVPHRVH